MCIRPSLFDTVGMRETQKSVIYDCLEWVKNATDNMEDIYYTALRGIGSTFNVIFDN